jgi:hypothetical protein
MAGGYGVNPTRAVCAGRIIVTRLPGDVNLANLEFIG